MPARAGEAGEDGEADRIFVGALAAASWTERQAPKTHSTSRDELG